MDIYNYILENLPDYAEVLADLNMNYLFSIKKNSSGITFLLPTAAMIDQLKSMSASDDDDKIQEATELIKSLVILDHIADLDEMWQKRDDLPNALRMRVPVKKYTKNNIVVDSAKVTPTQFDYPSRKNSQNIFAIDGFYNYHTKKSDFSLAVKKDDRGKVPKQVTDYRLDLFSKILVDYKNPNRNPCLEMLVTLLDAAQESDPVVYKTLCTLLSYDTITTLFIILDPFNPRLLYLNDDLLQVCERWYTKKKFPFYCTNYNPVEAYQSHMQNGVLPYHDDPPYEVDRKNWYSVLVEFQANMRKLADCGRSNNTAERDLYEAELRLVMALLNDNNASLVEIASRLNTYADMKPKILTANRSASRMNQMVAKSTIFLIGRCEASYYFPTFCQSGESIDSIDDNNVNVIYLDSGFKGEFNDTLASYYTQEFDALEEHISKLKKKKTASSSTSSSSSSSSSSLSSSSSSLSSSSSSLSSSSNSSSSSSFTSDVSVDDVPDDE